MHAEQLRVLKEKEEERAFWADMSLARSESNQQRGVKLKSGEGEDEGEGPSPPVSDEVLHQPEGNARPPPPGKESRDRFRDQSQKPKTKTFDKHRQKSRALKKGDSYQG